jgi:membrane associated rhomboid family serine protease
MTTILLTLLALLAGLTPILQLERGGDWWQLLTCHFTHWTYEQLAWDALAFLALGVACERRNRAAFHATLLASAVTIPLAVLIFAPEVTEYRGLSGLASALFVLLLVDPRNAAVSAADAVASRHRRERDALGSAGEDAGVPRGGRAKSPPLHSIILGAVFAAKIVFELTTSSAVFAGDITPVPIAHIAGAITALIIVTLRAKSLVLAPLLLASCISANNPTRVTGCTPGEVAGTWDDFRMTQLGPAWAHLSLGCNCRYSLRLQLLFLRFAEDGSYKVEGNTIRLIRPNSDTLMPFEVHGNKLTLQEHATERHVYTRTSPCASCSPCPSR